MGLPRRHLQDHQGCVWVTPGLEPVWLCLKHSVKGPLMNTLRNGWLKIQKIVCASAATAKIVALELVQVVRKLCLWEVICDLYSKV